ncbi:MAG: hypothetical protein H0X29_11565 [Parachlamydiaceae bacterium]|nr:hypothetical protein [Parachlamydiaceae bacterium]
MNLFVNMQCRWLTATVTGIIVAAPTAIYNGLGTQAQKWGTSFVWDKGAETVSCITQKNNTSNKLFKELNEKTSLIWNRVDNEIRNDLINQGFSFSVSTIDPSKNMLVAEGWLQQAVNSHQLYMKCHNERAICSQKLPDALNSTVVAQSETLKAKDESKAQMDPLLVRKGECKRLEEVEEENQRLGLIEKENIKQTEQIKNLDNERNQTIAANQERINNLKESHGNELNRRKATYEERIDNLKESHKKEVSDSKTSLEALTTEMEKYKKEAGDSKNSLEKMTKQMEKYRTAYKAKLWIDNDKEL